MPGGGPGHYIPPPGPPPHAPPSQPQHYGPQYQGQNGGQQQPFFQYSQCTGKRKALLIGINYAGTSAELRGWSPPLPPFSLACPPPLRR